MRVNRGGTGGGSTNPGDGQGATKAPAGSGTGGNGAAGLPSRTDRGNQTDEDIGSSATRGGGEGEVNAPRSHHADSTDMPDSLGG